MVLAEANNNVTMVLLGGFLLSFIITYISIPPLLDIARTKNLYDIPNGRTSHEVITPTLGGVAIFAGFVISSMIFLNISKIPYMQYVLVGIIIIFFIGLKDDLLGLSPLKKFMGEIIASGIIIDMGNIRIIGLHGFAGINALSPVSSDFLSLFVIVAVINAFNLIDGIDGLSSGIGILASLTFGIWFYLAGQIHLAIMAVILVGALLAFFRFNFFSKNNKIFMGDIGSLLLGLILAIFAIKFNEINGLGNVSSRYFIKAAPSVSIGILIVPIFDTVRVVIIRMMRGISPFKPDKRHLHHYLLELTGSHQKSTLIILGINVFFIVISFLLRNLNVNYHAIVILLLAGTLSFIPYYMVRQRRKKNIVGHYSAHIE